ncbi:hypothetical protein Tdes44962_MAKER08407 [Teratosphaeria destructans]|uniref:Uncharacterized protein n=1 Tax=Teratosphaeria destructans TaxID=418781 RepID=A0A9W7SWL8_9PEZI|nr:hypothetical protein Tdes44962_MAKER08407 [Teratosphaeria destructans]
MHPLILTLTLLHLLPSTLASYAPPPAASLTGYSYGKMFYLGPIPNHNYITRATYSLHVPPTPTRYRTDRRVWLALWIGLQYAGQDIMNEDFVQPLLNWAVNQEATGCPAPVTNWCAAASTYTPAVQVQQPYVPIPAGKTLDFEDGTEPPTVTLAPNKFIHQYIRMDGRVISQQLTFFYSGTECFDYGCGTVAAHRWYNITLVLNAPTAGLDRVLTLSGARCSGLQTPDGGKTWKIASIDIEGQDLSR